MQRAAPLLLPPLSLSPLCSVHDCTVMNVDSLTEMESVLGLL